ncbi:hypothetical protein HO173_007498 [Letharia columbiana]|uniref:DUF6594 domain-containing protein n=1 Tax=Letharia columbiana TaxID=112416 RepID=A0A8H6L3L6_9LECA|nr:uncharacterized protein HO173_007498 [Letharia columbiana]KAF6234304.1 hypothetical protein HO173_007498 [Letharia columbiana]
MEGYAKLASLMGANPEVAILRRFGAMNAQNLLYFQAELVALEDDLRYYADQDSASDDLDRKLYSECWDYLSKSDDKSSGSDERAGQQWRTMLRIREKLKEYNEALLHQTALAGLQKPNPRDLSFLQQWMESVSMGNVRLVGQDSDVWSKPDKSDLIALQARHADDPLTAWVTNTGVHWWHQVVGKYLRQPEATNWSANTVSYSQTGLSRLPSLVGVVLASLLPIASIVVLYTISSDLVRLIVIGLFTAGFSTSLKLVTNARLVDVFTATAAFTAVQVVFVGTNGSAGGNNH